MKITIGEPMQHALDGSAVLAPMMGAGIQVHGGTHEHWMAEGFKHAETLLSPDFFRDAGIQVIRLQQFEQSPTVIGATDVEWAAGLAAAMGAQLELSLNQAAGTRVLLDVASETLGPKNVLFELGNEPWAYGPWAHYQSLLEEFRPAIRFALNRGIRVVLPAIHRGYAGLYNWDTWSSTLGKWWETFFRGKPVTVQFQQMYLGGWKLNQNMQMGEYYTPEELFTWGCAAQDSLLGWTKEGLQRFNQSAGIEASLITKGHPEPTTFGMLNPGKGNGNYPGELAQCMWSALLHARAWEYTCRELCPIATGQTIFMLYELAAPNTVGIFRPDLDLVETGPSQFLRLAGRMAGTTLHETRIADVPIEENILAVDDAEKGIVITAGAQGAVRDGDNGKEALLFRWNLPSMDLAYQLPRGWKNGWEQIGVAAAELSEIPLLIPAGYLLNLLDRINPCRIAQASKLIPAPLLGDMDQDGDLDLFDIVLLVDKVLANDNPQTLRKYAQALRKIAVKMRDKADRIERPTYKGL